MQNFDDIYNRSLCKKECSPIEDLSVYASQTFECHRQHFVQKILPLDDIDLTENTYFSLTIASINGACLKVKKRWLTKYHPQLNRDFYKWPKNANFLIHSKHSNVSSVFKERSIWNRLINYRKTPSAEHNKNEKASQERSWAYPGLKGICWYFRKQR